MGFGSYLQPQTLVSICLSVCHAHARMRTHVCCRVPADETLLSARLSTPEKVKAKWRASMVLRQQESLTYAPKYMLFFLVFFKTCLYLEATLAPVAVRLFQEGLCTLRRSCHPLQSITARQQSRLTANVCRNSPGRFCPAVAPLCTPI